MTDKPIVRVPASASPLWLDGMMSDSFANFVSRLGTGSGKSGYAGYMLPYLNRMDIDAAYRTTWFRKICDIIPNDEVREWRTWSGADEQQIRKIDAEERRLDFKRKVRQARTLARKDGGAVIFIGAGGNAASELRPDSIGRGGIKYLTVLSRDQIHAGERENNPQSPYFDQPREYRISTGVASVTVHPSRVIRFIGNPITTQGYWDGWGDSIWVEIRQKVVDADRIGAAVAEMTEEAKLDVFKVKGLVNNLMDAVGTDRLTRRFSTMNQLKSIANAMVIDTEDAYEQKTLTFQGLKDIQTLALSIMAGIADIPATRLLGRSPEGMNATGDSDMRNYYDRIRSGQNVDLSPTLMPLDECLIRSALGERPETVFYEWTPLYQMSEKEAMEVEKIAAETLDKYVTMAVVPETVAVEMAKGGIIERGQWPGAEKAFADAEAAGEEAGLLEEPTEADVAEENARLAIAMQTANDPTGSGDMRTRLAANDATPRTLYVRRDVVNRADIEKWAREQGFTDIVPDLHVTIAYSTTPVDWFKVGTSWTDKIEISAGGPRQMDALGPTGEYKALLITANELVWRNREIRDAGASWDWPDYQPHISIQVGGVMPADVKPYQGKIVLGPEIFEEVRSGD